MGAQLWEIAADRLDRLPRKSLIDGLVQERSVTEDGHATGTNQPQDGGEGRCNESDRHGEHNQTRVELRGRCVNGTNVEIAPTELANGPHAAHDEDNVKEQPKVGDEAVDAEHGKEDGIVAGEVAEIIVDTRLDLAKVLRLRHALQIKEFRQWFEIGEAGAEGLRTHAGQTIGEVETRREHVNGDLDACHVERCRF